MLRPLTDDEAARVVALGTFEIDLVKTANGVRQRRAAIVYALDDPQGRGQMLFLSEEEECLIRGFDYLSRDENGAFGVLVGPDGRLARDA